uniref:uncharacterized protein LOC123989464 isoform X2 n=1 Tax=Oncorhynchus gorbuscha TaxID=8017 RepID=UPI001EAED209|nr:uncharacterized protein LOC123989464 isoform X2 [Oncorhynchus gorbuscha]
MNWCRIGSVSCVWKISGTPDGTSVTLQQTTDATRRNVLMVTKGGLKMENTGWYRCGVGDLIMPVHITVRQQTTTQSTTTMTTTQAPTTEQSSFSPTAEPVQTDNTVQRPEGSKEKVAMSVSWVFSQPWLCGLWARRRFLRLMSGSYAHKLVSHVRIQRAVHRQMEQADCHRSENPVFHPGDCVWLSTRNLPLHLPCKKLSPWFAGGS